MDALSLSLIDSVVPSIAIQRWASKSIICVNIFCQDNTNY